MDIVIYRDVGGFPVWFGLRSCFFCVTCRRDLHVALWWFSGYEENCHLQVWRCWISGGMTTTHQDWVTPNEGIEGVEGGARHGCGVQMSGVMDASFLQGVRRGGTQNTAVAPPHWKQLLKVVQVSEDDASLMPPGRDVSGMSHQEGRYTGEILSFGWVGNTSCHGWIDVYLIRRRQWYVTLDSFQTIWDLGSLHH